MTKHKPVVLYEVLYDASQDHLFDTALIKDGNTYLSDSNTPSLFDPDDIQIVQMNDMSIQIDEIKLALFHDISSLNLSQNIHSVIKYTFASDDKIDLLSKFIVDISNYYNLDSADILHRIGIE